MSHAAPPQGLGQRRGAPTPRSVPGPGRTEATLGKSLARLEQRVRLATPSRPWPTLALGMAELLLANMGQDSIQTLVLHDRTLLDLPDLVEDRVGQVEPLMPDRKTAIRIVEDLHPLPGDLAGRLIRLEQEHHLVVLQRQPLRDPSLFFPA